MKRILFYVLITLTCFNLAGGYTLAAARISQQQATASPVAGQHQLKKAVIELQTVQLNKEDSEDETLLPALLFVNSSTGYSFTPDFKLLNKHFLLQYGTAIKDKGLPAYILHQNFRL